MICMTVVTVGVVMVILYVYASSGNCTCICVFAWVVSFMCFTQCFSVAMRFCIFSDGEKKTIITFRNTSKKPEAILTT